MFLLLLGLALLAGTGCLSFIARGRPIVANLVGVTGAVSGSVLVSISALSVLFRGKTVTASAIWNLPFASFALRLDSLSAFFVVLTCVISALVAPYAAGISDRALRGRACGHHWLFYNLLVLALTVVLLAANGVLFLMAWEIVTLSSFGFALFQREGQGTQKAAYVHLVIAHVGLAILLAMFSIMSPGSTFDFAALSVPPGLSGMLFLFAVFGFGGRAGLVPFHLWLPETNVAAPAHVSALISGVMTNTGVYGLLRMQQYLGAPSPWWGIFLVILGVITAVSGIIWALAQSDLKRLLAYSSVQNSGSICCALGLALIGDAVSLSNLATFGFVSVLLFVLNHSVVKSLLFLSAGAVRHSTGATAMEGLGGLMKRMPYVGIPFLAGAAAMAGLPPVSGFFAQFAGYFAAVTGILSGRADAVFPCLFALLGFALAGGLGLACFAKAFGAIFLGEPRSENALKAPSVFPVGFSLRIPMYVLAACSGTMAFCAPLILDVLEPVLSEYGAADRKQLTDLWEPLRSFSTVAIVFLTLGAVIFLLKKLLLRRREVVTNAGTWDGGCAETTSRMQYTASSFTQPISVFFSRVAGRDVDGEDVWERLLYKPAFELSEKMLLALKKFQYGSVQLYILYIMVTLIGLILWQVRRI